MGDQHKIPLAGSLNVKEHETFSDQDGARRTVLYFFDGGTPTRVSDVNPLPTTGGGGPGGSNTEYTEGDVDTSITGIAFMWEDASDTLRAVSAAKPLPVNIVAGATAGTEYTEGDTDASITGTAIMWEDAADTLRAVSATKPLPVDVKNTSLDVRGATVAGDPSNGRPVEIGGHASSTPLTAVLDGDVQDVWVDVNGRVAVFDGNQTLSVDDGSSSLTVDNGTLAVVGGGTEATALRVTIANNSTGLVSIDDNGGSLTVDSTNLDIRDLSSASDSVTADTELPAAAALADGASNPTTPLIGACRLMFNGTTWDRDRNHFYQDTNNIAGTGAGTAVVMTTAPMSRFSLTVAATSATAYNVELQGSNDNSNWFVLISSNSVTGVGTQVYVADKPVRYMRYNVVSLAGGGANLFTRILATR